KRFTGGGTVFLDKNTMICSIIGKHQLLQRQTLFPRDIMRWSANFYKQAFKDHLEDFKLEADDYVIGDRKIGGNAQYITGGKTQRFVHHTSFLYDFDVKNMEYLLLPDKIPEYRRKRDHADFLSTIK